MFHPRFLAWPQFMIQGGVLIAGPPDDNQIQTDLARAPPPLLDVSVTA